MSNLSSIESDSVSDLNQNAAPTEEQARAAMVHAGLTGVDLVKLEARKIVGLHSARGLIGHILARSVMTHAQAEVISQALFDIIVGKITTSDPVGAGIEIQAGVDSKITAADAWARVQKVMGERDLVALKAAEITAKGSKKEGRGGLAPQVRSAISHLHFGPTQVNNGNPDPKA